MHLEEAQVRMNILPGPMCIQTDTGLRQNYTVRDVEVADSKKLAQISLTDKIIIVFHGTSLVNANKIMASGFKIGPNNSYGRGIYSTTELKTALSYAVVNRQDQTFLDHNIANPPVVLLCVVN